MADLCRCGDEWGSHMLTDDGSCWDCTRRGDQCSRFRLATPEEWMRMEASGFMVDAEGIAHGQEAEAGE